MAHDRIVGKNMTIENVVPSSQPIDAQALGDLMDGKSGNWPERWRQATTWHGVFWTSCDSRWR